MSAVATGLIRRGMVAAAAVLSIAAATPGAAHARVVVAKVGAAPSLLTARQAVAVPVTLRRAGARGGTVRLRLVLGSSARPKGGTLLDGRPTTVRVGRRARLAVIVRGDVPATLPAGRTMRLLVCADAAKAVAGKARKGACAAAKRKLTVPADGAGARIDAEVAAGRLPAARALQYKLSLLVGRGTVPARFRGPLGDVSEHGLIVKAASSFGSLPRDVRRATLPLMLPPAAQGSAWAARRANPKRRAKAKRKARAAQDLQPNCGGHQRLSGPIEDGDGYLQGRWTSIVTSDRRARVHYVDWTPVRPVRPTTDPAWVARHAVEVTREQRAAALRFAAAMPGIWSKLTGPFGPPQSDAGEPCYHGPDGKFDIYVGADVVNAIMPGAPAVTRPYPAVGNFPVAGQFCTDRPAFIAIKKYADNFTLAHEFMHAIQFAHRYQTCAEPVAFWDEGVANWAANFVYPDDQHEQNGGPHNFLIKFPLDSSPLQTTGYAWWPLWMMLHREYGIDVLKGVFSAMRNAPAIDAVDQAMPGGWAQQLPNLLVHLWNQDPIGAPGFPIDVSYKSWDHWNGIPEQIPEAKTLYLGGAQERTIELRPPAAPGPLDLALIQRVTINDEDLRELRFTNGAAGRPLHTDAALRLADGSWKLVDWSNRSTVTLCRDKPDEDVRELIVFATSVSKTAPVPFEHQLRGRDACEEGVYYKVLAAKYEEDLDGTAYNPMGACGLSGVATSFHETNLVSLGQQPFDPVNRLDDAGDGARSGQIGASGLGTISGTLNGCDISVAPPWPPCTRSFGGELTGGPSLRITIPKDSNIATVQWPLTNVGGNFPGADPVCMTDPFRTSSNTEVLAEEQRPSSIFLSDEPQTISFAKSRTGQVMGGQITSGLSYSITFQRVREDGTPL